MENLTVKTRNSSSSIEHSGNAVYRDGKGQLKLSVNINNGLMTVHVIKARHLGSKSKSGCNATVKIAVVPDDFSKRRKCKTSVVHSNHPVFDQRFTMEVNESDYEKRLYISVHSRDSEKSEFLGCMSFGMKKLMRAKRHVSGWYFLLTQEAGRNKHLQSVRRKSGVLTEKASTNNSTTLCKSPEHVKDAFTLVMHKKDGGFGFTVTGSNPVYVEKVESGSAAAEAGLLTSDHIAAVNGLNVVRASFQNVAKLVRNSGSPLILDVERRCEPGKCPWQAYIQHGCVMDVDHSDHNKENKPTIEDNRTYYNTEHQQFPIYEEILERDSSRQEAIKKLVECEEEFIHVMQSGIQRYSRPLRHRFLNPPEHRAVFQNVEKLVMLSQYYCHQLASSNTDQQSIGESPCGQVYLSKVGFLCEAYETYCAGLRKADRVLTLLVRSKNDLNSFLERCAREEKIDVGSFIHRPAEHLTELIHQLHEVISATSPSDKDYQSLQQVIIALQQSYARIHGETPDKISSSSSSSSLQQSSSSKAPSVTSHPSSRCQSSSSYCSQQSGFKSNSSSHIGSSASSVDRMTSVDMELLSLQNCIDFADNVNAFPLALPSRHLIYAGELLRIEEKQWIKLHAVLLTDMILLTKKGTDGRLTVILDPIFISNVTSADFDCAHPSEFQLELEPASEESFDRWEEKSLTLRAPSIEQKCVWKSLTEHRISAQRTLQELAPTTCQVHNFMDKCDFLL